ncbi:11631_t:CDS:2, partial [Dentiscutata heterogama]
KEFYQLSTAYNILTDETECFQMSIFFDLHINVIVRPPKQSLKITDTLDTYNQTYNNDNTRQDDFI